MILSPQFDARIVDCVAYFDRVTVWLKNPLYDEELEDARLQSGATIECSDVLMFQHLEYRQRLVIYQPTRDQLLTLQRFMACDALVNNVEIACDVITNSRADALQLQAEFDSVSVKTYQRRSKVRVRGTKDQDDICFSATCYSDRRHASTNLVTYADRKSKVIDAPCFHCELRISGEEAVRSAGINCFNDLLTIDLVAALSKRVRLYKAPTDIAERIGRDLFRLDLNRSWGRGHYRAGLNKKISPARRIGSIVLRSLFTDDDGRYDMFELKKLGKCIGIDFMRHFDKATSEELFRPKQLQ